MRKVSSPNTGQIIITGSKNERILFPGISIFIPSCRDPYFYLLLQC